MHFATPAPGFSAGDLEAQIEEMIAQDFLTEQQARSIDVAKIRGFRNHPWAKDAAVEKVTPGDTL